MKNIVKELLIVIMRVVSWLYSYDISQKIKASRDIIYTTWLRNFLASIGKDSTICYPCKLGDNPQLIDIGDNTVIRDFCVIQAETRYKDQIFNSSIIVGNNCDIGAFNHITSVGNIIIGNGVLTGRRVLISNNNHGDFSEEYLEKSPVNRDVISRGDIIIEDNVWIGEGASILGKIRIGKGAVIGANAVVTKDVCEYTLVAGNPAKTIKKIEKNNTIRE